MSWQLNVLIPASGKKMALPDFLNMKPVSLYLEAKSMRRKQSFGLGCHILVETVMIKVSGLTMHGLHQTN